MLSQERIAELDKFYAKPTISPERMAELDAYYGEGEKEVKKPDSFIGEMGENLKHGIQSASDLLSGEYEDIGRTKPTPKTQALADKLFPEGSDGAFKDAIANTLRNTSPSDWAGALLEKFAATPEGKVMAVIGGVNPVYNAASTAVNRYVNPAIATATGAHPDTIAATELIAAPFMASKVRKSADPGVMAVKKIAEKAPDVRDAIVEKLPEQVKDTAIGRGMAARDTETLQSDAAANLKSAGQIYEQMKAVGATIGKEKAVDIANSIENAVKAKEFIPNLNPKTLSIVEHIKEQAKTGEMTLAELDQYRRLLGRVGASEDGVSAGVARNAIDEAVGKITDKDLVNGSMEAVTLLNEGRKAYAQASKFDDIADILIKADGDANKIKAGLTKFLDNEKNTRGWSKEEITALRQAAESTPWEKILKAGGKFGVDFGTSTTPGNTIAPVVGAMVNPALPVAGTIMRQGHKYVARGKAEMLLKKIQEGKKPTAKEIGELSPKEAETVLKAMRK